VGKTFFSFPELPEMLWDPPSLLLNGSLWHFFLGIGWAGSEANHSPVYNAEIKNEYLYVPLCHHVCSRTTLFYLFSKRKKVPSVMCFVCVFVCVWLH
jgi:hypothetical protein